MDRTYNPEPDFADLLRLIWQGKFFVLAGLIFGLVAAFFIMKMAVPHYQAYMVVAPPERATTYAANPTVLQQDRSAIRFLQNSISADTPPDFLRYHHGLTGQGTAEALAGDETVAAYYATDKRFSFMADRDSPPGAATLAHYLQRKVGVESLGTSPLRKLSFQHPDRDFVAVMLRTLHDVTERRIRNEVAQRTQSRIAYLRQQLAAAPSAEQRRILTNLLIEQEHIQMILQINEPFAAKIIEPVSVSEKPVWPCAALVYPVSVFVGIFLALFLCAAIRAGARDKTEKKP